LFPALKGLSYFCTKLQNPEASVYLKTKTALKHQFYLKENRPTPKIDLLMLFRETGSICVLIFGCFLGVRILYSDVSEHSVSYIFIGGVSRIYIRILYAEVSELSVPSS